MLKRCAMMTLVLAVLMALAPSQPLADEGRIPLLSLPGPPFVITAPGHYILTEDVTFAGNIILIQSNQVTVDLNGFNLTGDPGSPVIAIDSALAPFFVTIRNGTLRNGSTGIQHVGTDRVRVWVENVTIDSMAVKGISLDRAAHAEIVSCHVRNISGDGIFVSGFDSPFYGRILDNEALGLNGYGIRLEGLQAGVVRRNVVGVFGFSAGTQAGLILTDVGAAPGAGAGGNIIEGNTVSVPFVDGVGGIHLASSDGNLIENNVVKQNTASGIRLEDSSRNKVYNNVAHQNAGNGLETAGSSNGNFFLENTAGDNGGLGIDCLGAGTGDHLRGNMLLGDGFGALCVDAGQNIP